mgnify:CR=1 FL=1
MSPNPRVLVVDDEAPLAGAIAEYLRREGFVVTVTHDGISAVTMARRDEPDLIILDLMLPGIDGIEVCRQVRQFSSAYVIMLTARDGELDKVLGLSMGADDYLVKPFVFDELLARIGAVSRRVGASAGLTGADLQIDPASRRVTRDGREIRLTAQEFSLLRTLAEMENLRKRTEREVADARTYGVTGFARDILTVADNMHRAMSALDDELRSTAGESLKGLLDGVELTERELLNVLEKHGVKKLEPLKQKFDPNRHQAMYEIEDASVPSGTVLQVVQSGYVIGDRVLRPALVGVAKGGPKAAANPAAPPRSTYSAALWCPARWHP